MLLWKGGRERGMLGAGFGEVVGGLDGWGEISRVPNKSVRGLRGLIEGPGELLAMICRARRPLTTRLSFDFLSSRVWTSAEDALVSDWVRRLPRSRR